MDNPAFSTFVGLMLSGQGAPDAGAAVLGYRQTDGALHIDQITPGQAVLVDVYDNPNWDTGYTAFVSLSLGDQQYVWAYRASKGDYCIFRLDPNGSGLTQTYYNPMWNTGYSGFAGLQLGSDAYLWAYRQSTGDYCIFRLDPNGSGLTQTCYNPMWDAGYSGFAGLRLESDAYLWAYRQSKGDMVVFRLDPNGAGLSQTYYSPMWDTGYSGFAGLQLGTDAYLWAYRQSKGDLCIFRLDPNGAGLSQTYYSPMWDTAYDSFCGVQLQGAAYVWAYRGTDDRFCIHLLNAGGQGFTQQLSDTYAAYTFAFVNDTHASTQWRPLLVRIVNVLNNIRAYTWPSDTSRAGKRFESLVGTFVQGDLTDYNDWFWIPPFGPDYLEDFRQLFEPGYAAGGLQVPLFGGLGNHDIDPVALPFPVLVTPDYLRNRMWAYLRQYHQPRVTAFDAPANGSDSGGYLRNSYNYLQEYGGFAFLQLNRFGGDTRKYHASGMDWLAQQLAQLGAAKRIVVGMHYGWDTSMTIPPDAPDAWWSAQERAALLNLLRNHNVIAVLTGHSHDSLRVYTSSETSYTLVNPGGARDGFFGICRIGRDHLDMAFGSCYAQAEPAWQPSYSVALPRVAGT